MFTKPAIPGRVKTRLVGDLSAADAARLHRAMLEDLVASLARGSFALRLVWALEKGERLPASWLERGVECRVQRGRDLGERLLHSLTEAARDFARLAVAGSDLPDLEAARVEEAFELLEGACEVVLGPTEDGGYYLLAIRAEHLTPGLFENVDWSSERVLAQTLQRCTQHGLRVALLPVERDVDTFDDLRGLERRLADGRSRSPRVAALLHELDAVHEAG